MTFLFDEQMSVRLARALRELGEHVAHVQDVDGLGKGSSDEAVIEYAARMDHRVVTMDRKIKRNPHLKRVYLESGAGVYFVKTGKKQRTDLWEIVTLIIQRWEELKRDAATQKRPFMRLVTKRAGITRYE